jgi:dihydropteroate synthase
MNLNFKGFTLDLHLRTHIMGILNVTPDSFSDGGDFFKKDDAIRRAHKMVSQGADIIDVGGMSTRPGSLPVSIEEETNRVVPVIEAIAKEVGVPVSIDSYNFEVAQRAIEAGATMINDISGLRFSPQMAPLASKHELPVIAMHIKGYPKDMQLNPTYEALVPEICDALRESINIALNAGVKQIIIDPGIGFGKTFDHNLELINRLKEFTLLGYPVLVGPSRKAFIGEVLGGIPATERLDGTSAAVAACVLNGASIVRVHDVKAMSHVARMCDSIKRESVG